MQPSSTTKPIPLPRNIWVLGFGSLLMDTSSEMIHAILPLFLVNSLGATMIAVGLIEGLAEAAASVTRIFSGALSDYIGRRKPLIVAGYCLSALSKPLFAAAATTNLVLFARVFDRIGKGVRGSPRDALVADSTTADQRGAAYGLRQALDTIGAVVGPAIAVLIMIVSQNNYKIVFWVAVLPACLAVLLFVLGIKEPKTLPVRPEKQSLNFAQWQTLSASYWWLVVIAFVFNLGNSSDAFLLLKAKSLHINDSLIPLVLITLNATFALSSYPAGVLSDRFGQAKLFMAGLLLYFLNYLGLAYATAQWQLWLLSVSYGLQLGISQGTFMALVSHTVPQDLRGTAFGILNMVVACSLLFASLAAGYLWQTFSPTHAFLAGALFALLALSICASSPKWHSLVGRNIHG